MSAPAPTEPQLRREFTLFSAFTLAFAYISPIVAVYGVFALALALVGPSYWLAIPFALAGQILVSLSLGEVASRFPYEGSLYQWAGRLIGPRFGWLTGWTYVWTVMIAMATVTLGAAGFWAAAFHLEADAGTTIVIALVLLAVCTFGNLIGRKPLKIMIVVSITAEIIGSIGLGVILLVFYHVNPIDVIFHSASGMGLSGFVLAIGLAGWSFLGFESSGSVAEEVQEPERNVPKALRYSLIGIGIIVLFSSLSFILAIPNLDAVIAGEVGDPIDATLSAHLAPVLTSTAGVIFAVGFTACCLGLQTGTSRIIYAFARDRALPGSRWLSKLSKRQAVPLNAILITLPVVIVLILLNGSNIYNVLVSYTIGGWYFTFFLVLIGFVVTRLRGRWRPGSFTMGRWSMPVLTIATLWAAFETVNIAWPREEIAGPEWSMQWAVVLVQAALLLIGWLVMLSVQKTWRFGTLPEGTEDASAQTARHGASGAGDDA